MTRKRQSAQHEVRHRIPLDSAERWELQIHKAAFTPENAAMLLIDHQLGTVGWTYSHDSNLVEANALKLAKIAKALRLRRSTFRETDSQFARPPRCNAERPGLASRKALQRGGICNVAAIE